MMILTDQDLLHSACKHPSKRHVLLLAFIQSWLVSEQVEQAVGYKNKKVVNFTTQREEIEQAILTKWSNFTFQI